MPNNSITWLRDQAIRMPEEVHKRGMIRAADTMEALAQRNAQLGEELKDEMYRHDRLQDFEVAEADELARVKAINAAMSAALKNSDGCGNCKHCYALWNEEPCDSCRQDPGFPAWEWNGNIRGWAK